MNRRLGDLGEGIVGFVLWYGSIAWNIALGAFLVCTPLLLAYGLTELVDGLPATVALAAGVVGAYALDMPPWLAEERRDLVLLIVGAALSVFIYDRVRGGADAMTILVVLALTSGGWPVRRALTRRGLTWNRS